MSMPFSSVWLMTAAICLANAGPVDPPSRPSEERRRSPIHVLLQKRVNAVDWDEAPLRVVLEWIREQSEASETVNVIPRWRALAVEGIDEETPVTLEMRDARVGSILVEVLDQISGVDPIVYYGQGNVIRITTRTDVRRKLMTRAYDVSEVLAQAAAARIEPGLVVGQEIGFVGTLNVNQGGTGANVQILPVGTSLFGDAEDFYEGDEDDDDALRDELADQMIGWITTTIEPDTWDVNGGPGTIRLFNGALIIRNSADVHQELVGAFILDR